jgi:hypothetical protein
MKLIKGEWWNPPTRLITDEKGQVQLNCFLGEYKLTCGTRQETFVVTKEKMPVIQVNMQ